MAKSPKQSLDFRLEQEADGQWVAYPPQGDFVGYGDTIQQAIGDALITNREDMGFTFVARDKNNCTKISNYYNNPRPKDQLGENEKKARTSMMKALADTTLMKVDHIVRIHCEDQSHAKEIFDFLDKMMNGEDDFDGDDKV